MAYQTGTEIPAVDAWIGPLHRKTTISFIKHERDPDPVNMRATSPHELIEEPHLVSVDKYGVPMFFPCVFTPAEREDRPGEGAQRWRLLDQVEMVLWLVYDIDQGLAGKGLSRLDFWTLREVLTDYAHVLYSSHSCFSGLDGEDPENIRLRLILPVAVSASAAEAQARYWPIAEALGFAKYVDPAAKGISRAWYLPCARPGAETIAIEHHGKTLDWREFEAGQAAPAAPAVDGDVLLAGFGGEMHEYSARITAHLRGKMATLKRAEQRLLLSRVIDRQPLWQGSGCANAGLNASCLLGTIMALIPGTRTPFPVAWAEQLLLLPLRSMDTTGCTNKTSGPAIWEKCGKQFRHARDHELGRLAALERFAARFESPRKPLKQGRFNP